MKYKSLINSLISRNIIKAEEADIYIYGLENALLNLFNILISASLSLLFHSTGIYIFLLLTFIPLRRSAGGFHFNNPIVCMFFSQMCLLIPQLIISHIVKYQKVIIVLFIIFFPLLLFTTIKKRSIGSKKRYTDDFLIKKHTKKAIKIEILYFFLFIGLITFHQIEFASVILYVILFQLILFIIPEM